jgi:hypothetical protein
LGLLPAMAAGLSKTVGIREDLIAADSKWVKEDVSVPHPLFAVFRNQRRWRSRKQDFVYS